MNYSTYFMLIISFCYLSWGVPPITPELVGGQNNSNVVLVGGCDDWKCTKSCKDVYPLAKKVLGSELNCMMRLFYQESTCNTVGPQAAGNEGNPAAGFGLCTLEVSSAKRNKRGRNCRRASYDNVEAQILCCRDIMAAFGVDGSYFGPVRRGEIPKCI
jgi:hypothetical protein